jgi:hypothetical protein
MAAINLRDLTPFTRRYSMRPGDAWIFRMKFWQNFTGQAFPLDIRSFRVTAKLYQLVDSKWKYVLTVNQTNKTLNDDSLGNYLYLDPTDEQNAGLVFAADWVQADVAEGDDNQLLSEGEYKLEFSYNSELSFTKSFATYLVDLTEKPREDEPLRLFGIDFFLILKPEVVNIEINNTIINGKTSNF